MAKWFSEHRVVLIRWAGTLLAVLLLLILLREEKWEDIVLAVRQVSLRQFLLAFALMIVSRLFVVGRWHVLMRSGGVNISVKESAALTFTGLFASNFLPTTVGGDLARFAGAMQLGFDRAVCLASLVADRLIGMLGMVLALPFGLVPFIKSLALVSTKAIAFTPLFQKFLGFIRRTFSTFSIWLKKPLALVLSLGFTLGNMAFIFASIYVLTSGLGRDVSYWLIAGLWSLTYFVTLVPVSINGYGVQEFSLTYLLAKLGGLDHAQSVTIAVLIRLLFILASTPGAIYLPAILSAMNRNQESQLNEL